MLQTLAALEAAESAEVVQRVRVRARLPQTWPEGLIPEAWFVRLVAALRAELPPERAEPILEDAGARTARYVAAHRIPRLFRWALAVLPSAWAVPLLLSAFRRHAWTFAGAGRFDVESSTSLVLDDSPTCRTFEPSSAGRTGRTGRTGRYYAAAFQGLLSVASPGVRVREVACRAAGDPVCRFAVETARSEGA